MRSVEWLAGLLEGEGCFFARKSGINYMTPSISVTMTDEDVIDAAKELMEHIGGRSINVHARVLPSLKVAYSAVITGLPAAVIMHAVYPYMGKRRANTIFAMLTDWHPVKYKEAAAFRESMALEAA